MTNQHAYRPCISCGGVEFDNLPYIAFELHYIRDPESNLPIMMKLPGGSGLVFTAVVCSGCGRTDLYTKNATKVAQRIPGATHFRAG
jgi:predicted nucleic-acid-binding Zn-ribbon protein